MHVFFEDDGAFKAGTVLADNDTSLQVETASGKRMKIKAANVLLRFAIPAPAALLAEAQSLASGIDPAFLWEASGGGEFEFADLAARVFRPSAKSRSKPHRSPFACTPRRCISTRRARAATRRRRRMR